MGKAPFKGERPDGGPLYDFLYRGWVVVASEVRLVERPQKGWQRGRQQQEIVPVVAKEGAISAEAVFKDELVEQVE